MKYITLTGNIEIIPADGPDGDSKSIVLTCPHSGEVIQYSMTKNLVQTVARKLKQSNRALHLDLVEAEACLQAQAAMQGVPVEPDNGDSRIAQEILAGVRDPRRK